MKFKQITQTNGRGHLPKGECPACNSRIVKGIADRKLVYKCEKGHIGEWEARLRKT